MQVSVALAARNNERHLEALLESLARQTQAPFELVVTDDASEDSTPWILQEFANRAPFPVHIERFEERGGYVEAFMAAARRCSGEAIAFCDADDVWSEYKIAVCARELARSPAMLAMHSARVVDDQLHDAGREWPRVKHSELVPPLGLAGVEEPTPGLAMVFRSALLTAADFETRPISRHPTLPRMTHDEWVFFLAGALGPVQLVAEQLVWYRQHDSNTSSGAYRQKRRRTLRPVLGNYRHAGAYAASCAEYLERAAAANPVAPGRLQASAREYRRMARTWQLREELYGAGRIGRFRRLRDLVALRAYGPRREGGFGRSALAKDAFAGVALGVSRPADAEPAQAGG